MSLWRNRLARSAVNRKVGGSNPPRDEFFIIFIVNYFTFFKHENYNKERVQIMIEILCIRAD
jgi:hypothetical protein